MDLVSAIPVAGDFAVAAQMGIGIANTKWGDTSTMGNASEALTVAGTAGGFASLMHLAEHVPSSLAKPVAEAIPGFGTFVGLASTVVDGISAYQDYKSCMKRY